MVSGCCGMPWIGSPINKNYLWNILHGDILYLNWNFGRNDLFKMFWKNLAWHSDMTSMTNVFNFYHLKYIYYGVMVSMLPLVDIGSNPDLNISYWSNMSICGLFKWVINRHHHLRAFSGTKYPVGSERHQFYFYLGEGHKRISFLGVVVKFLFN